MLSTGKDLAGAELYEVLTTIEGDPVYIVYRTTPRGDLLRFIDNSADRFGGGSDFVTHACADLLVQDLDGKTYSEPVDCVFAGTGWG